VKVVITGIGLMTAFGKGADCFVKNIIDQKDGITTIERFNAEKYRGNQAGQVPLSPGQAWDMADLLEAAIKEALTDAELSIENDATAPSWIVGTSYGYLIDRERVNRAILGRDPAHGAHINGQIISMACVSSTHAIGLAKYYIESRKADCVIVGGVEILREVIHAGFHAVRALSPDKCCPFDKNRKGLVLGEGAGVLVIESQQRANQRKAKIYAEIAGFGSASDAFHLTAAIPNGKGLEVAILKALTQAQLDSKDLGYINAHGAGTIQGDRVESIVFQRIFGGTKNPIPVSSIKAAIGHTIGAGGVIDVALSGLCLTKNFLPATLNFKEPEKEFSLDYVTATREKKVDTVLSVNFAFGGNNAAVVLKKVRP